MFYFSEKNLFFCCPVTSHHNHPIPHSKTEDECPFAHSGSVDKKPEMCKFYLNAHCAKGKACIFMHEEYPCKFFHLGMTCYSGSDCKFSHAPLDAVTGPMIEKVSAQLFSVLKKIRRAVMDGLNDFSQLGERVGRSGVLIYKSVSDFNVTVVQPGDDDFMGRTAFVKSNFVSIRFAHTKN